MNACGRIPYQQADYACGSNPIATGQASLLPIAAGHPILLLEKLTTRRHVVIYSNVPAELLIDERHVLDVRTFVEIVVWRLPRPVRSCVHPFKYRLALVAGGECVLRYDNEAGKGDHRHIGSKEQPYRFTGTDALLADFWRDVDAWSAMQ